MIESEEMPAQGSSTKETLERGLGPNNNRKFEAIKATLSSFLSKSGIWESIPGLASHEKQVLDLPATKPTSFDC